MISTKKYIDSRFDIQQHAVELALENAHRLGATLQAELDSRITTVVTNANDHTAALQSAVDARVDSLHRELNTAIVTQKENVVKAEDTMNHRLDLLNELRQGVLPREAFDEYVRASADRYRTAMTSISARIDDVRNQVAALNTTVAKGPPELPQLQTQVAATAITRSEYEQKHEVLLNELARVRNDVSQLRTEIAKGPPELHGLANEVQLVRGQRMGSTSTLTVTISIVVLFIMLFGVIVALIVGLK